MKKRANPRALPASVPLYKVLTADGHSPYITAYAWSLPTQREDGSWEPGAWHEEPASVLKQGRGLHISPSPTHYTPRRDCVTYACEASGYREDPLTDHHVVATRVRLLHPITAEEADRVSREWDANRNAQYELAKQKKRLDRARIAATKATADRVAARKKGVESPALTAFRLLVELTPTESWRDVNGCRYDALKYATEWLRFDAEDVSTIHREFVGGRWFGSSEGLYALAIQRGNKSACVAWEHHFGRKPWWHRQSDGTRERLHVDARVHLGGAWHRITSFRADYLNTVRDSDGKVVKLTREQLDPNTSQRKVSA